MRDAIAHSGHNLLPLLSAALFAAGIICLVVWSVFDTERWLRSKRGKAVFFVLVSFICYRALSDAFISDL